MGVKQFYRNHLSKSLPLIFKNGCIKWQLTKDLFHTPDSVEQDNYMVKLLSDVEVHQLTKPKATFNDHKTYPYG
jgi:hypothetical protein